MSIHHDRHKCPTGKASYPSQHYAKIARDRITSKRNFRIYQCPVCFSYHLTSQYKKNHGQRNQRRSRKDGDDLRE